MKPPGLPSNEEARLAELRAYAVLDTEEDASFDALTALAADFLEVPIALISLVDEDRQWFKSHHGLAATETSREVSFCAHAVEMAAPLIVPDARADGRFADNPLVSGDPRIRFYAGVPLRTPSGFDLGTLCVLDHVPRELTGRQLGVLTHLASIVMGKLEASRAQRELLAEKARALEAAHRLEVLFEAMDEGVVVHDSGGAIVESNRAARRILGFASSDDIEGAPSPEWKTFRENGEPFPSDLHPSAVTLRTGKATRNVIMGVQKPSGHISWISINALPLKGAGPRRDGALVTFHDITALKAAQVATERLARQEHLITTGTLAAGVGHEINNPLTFVIANVELALDELRAIGGGSPSARIRDILQLLIETREGAERIHKIVQGLRALAREQSEPVATELDKVLVISINMAGHELRSKATLVKRLGEMPMVLADESRLSQVFVNLIVNAAQAFKTSDVERNRITLSSGVATDGRVWIDVADNGPGVPEKLRRRIFDPFFTTKPVGVGTGLGLSICHSIMTSLGGEISVESELGTGTTFRVLVPVAKTGSIPAAPDSSPRLEAKPDGARILVVDDEPSMVKTIDRVLGRDHDVVSVTDSREALRLIKSGERYDVVFCDLMMPHISGDALYELVRAIDAGLADRFVFISGGTTDPHTLAFLAEVPNERLEKPFSVQNLKGMARRFATNRPRSGA